MAGDLEHPSALLAAQVQTAQANPAIVTPYSPPHGAAIEGKEWTFHSGFNSNFMGQRLTKDAFRAEIYWYYGKPDDAQISGPTIEAGEIKQLQDGACEVTAKHMYTDDGHYQIRVLIFIKNHPKYCTSPWKYVTPPLTVWEAPVHLSGPTLTAQQGVPLRGLVAELVSEDPTPKPGEFGAIVGVPPGAWARPLNSTVTQNGSHVRVEVDATPLGNGQLSMTVNFHKYKGDKIVQSLGQVHHKVLVQKPDLQVTKAEWSAAKPNIVKATVHSQGYNGNASLRIFQSQDNKLDSGDTGLLAGPVVKFTAGETKTIEVALPPLAANNSPFGRSFNCFAVIDPANRIAEQNETNNWQLFRITQAGVTITWPTRYQNLQGRKLLDPRQFNDNRMIGAIAVVDGTGQGLMGSNCFDFALPGGNDARYKWANLAKQGGRTQVQKIGDIGIVLDRNGVPVHSFLVVGKTADGNWLHGQRNGLSMVYITHSLNDQKVAQQRGERILFVSP